MPNLTRGLLHLKSKAPFLKMLPPGHSRSALLIKLRPALGSPAKAVPAHTMQPLHRSPLASLPGGRTSST